MSNEKTDRHYISLKGRRNKIKCTNAKSLLALADNLQRDYVQIIGLCPCPIEVGSLSLDLLKKRVICYRIDSYKTFTVVLDGLDFKEWLG